MTKPKIIRQKSLFDDENSDLNYLKEELGKRRLNEIKKRVKNSEKSLDKKNLLC